MSSVENETGATGTVREFLERHPEEPVFMLILLSC